jgi:hypothetical protein
MLYLVFGFLECEHPNERITSCLGSRARRFALADSGLRLIDHKAGHLVEEFPKDLLGLSRQRSFPKSTIHQAHPSVAGTLIYMERRMPRAEAWMASLFDVSLWPSEPADQEISEALLGTCEICRLVHRSQKVILRNLSIEGGDQACEAFRANHRINFELLHFLSSPYRKVSQVLFYAGVECPRCIFDLGVRPAIPIPILCEFAPEDRQLSDIKQ